jgi:histidinol-phosphate aminotransferase
MSKFVELAKAPYRNEKLNRPDWTQDVSRPAGPLWLNKNENSDPILNKKILSLIPQVKNLAVNTYPELAKIYKKLALIDKVLPSNLLLTHGSDGAIRAVFDVFVEVGDKVLRTEPTFAMYDVYCKSHGASELLMEYQYTPTGPRLDFQKFLDLIKAQKPKLVCLPNPDSPSGTVLTEKEMAQLLEVTHAGNSLLLIDEAYFPFYSQTLITKVTEYKNLLVCRSFSKAWGAAGLRVGYLAGDEALMKVLHKSRPMYELSTFSSELTYLLLDCWQDVLDSVTRLEQGREYFIQEMKALGYVTTVSHGNFLHVDFSKDEKAIAEVLKGLVLYRTDFNIASSLKGFSRFSLATRDQFEPIVQKIKSIKK